MKIFVIRFTTSLVLLTLAYTAWHFLSPMQLSIVIAAIYLYAFLIEYLPLAQQGIAKNSLITISAGSALALTGFVHVWWAADAQYHVLGLSIGSAIVSDIGGYCAGTVFGMHLLDPVISPKKTWEGLIGSIVLTSGCLGLLTYWYTRSTPVIYAVILGVLLALAALKGDLLFSSLKRAAAVKDTGTILPGHGGILDRLDSIVGTTMLLLSIIALSMLIFGYGSDGL